MTLQYDQGDINLRDASPISVTTVDAVTPVVVDLDTLTDDGQSLMVSVYGGGSAPISAGNPGGVNAANYSITSGDAIFTREAGAGLIAGAVIIANGAGAFPIFTFLTDDITVPGSTICQLSIVGANPFNYVHRIKVSKIRF